MPLTDVVVGPGQTIGYTIRGSFTRLLTVSNRGNVLHFQEYDGAIGLISGDGMVQKLIQLNAKPPSGHLDVRILDDGHEVRLCTPQSYGRTGVYLGILDSQFHIEGGAVIIGTISGHDVRNKLELKLEDIELETA